MGKEQTLDSAVNPNDASIGLDDEQKKAAFVPALVVIDMQHDFVYGSLVVPDAPSIIEPVNGLIDLPFRMKIATRDFHPDNHVSFAKTHQEQVFSQKTLYHPDDTEQQSGLEQTLWPVHCVAHTEGAAFVSGLETTKFDAVVSKGTHPQIESYSAFQDVWAKGVTELPDLLKAQDITDVYFVGLAGDYCVKHTAVDSVDFGFKTWVITDAVKSISTGNDAFNELSKKGVHFTTITEVKKLLGAFAM